MSIIHKYLAREMTRYFALVLGVVIAVYLAVDFFEKIDNFLEKGVPLARVVPFFAFKIPLIVCQVMPVGVLLSVTIVLGLMHKNNELVALKSGGVGAGYLLKAVLVLAAAWTVVHFLLAEGVVPATIWRSNRIWLEEVKEQKMVSSKTNIWIKDNRSILHIKYYHPVERGIFGITFNRFDGGFRLVERIDAAAGYYGPEGWVLQEVMEQDLVDPANGIYHITFHEALPAPFTVLPEDLTSVVKKSEEMGFTELLAYAKKVESEGYDATLYRVDLHAKLAFPVICLIMGSIGAGIAFRVRQKDGLPVSIGIGIGIAFLYWIFHSFCLSLGYGGMLPPLMAAWAADLVFGCLAGFILLGGES